MQPAFNLPRPRHSHRWGWVFVLLALSCLAHWQLLLSFSNSVWTTAKAPTLVQAILLPTASKTLTPTPKPIRSQPSLRTSTPPAATTKPANKPIVDQTQPPANTSSDVPIYYEGPTNTIPTPNHPQHSQQIGGLQAAIQEPIPLAGADALAPNTSAVLIFDVFLNEQETPVGRQEHELNINGKHFHIKTRGEAVGAMSLFYSGQFIQSSEGTLAKDGFRPEKYIEQRGNKPETSATINWQTGDITFSDSEPRPTGRIDLGLQDRLTMPYQLGALAHATVAAGQTLKTDQVFTIPLMTTREVERISFTLIGSEMLPVENGIHNTWHFAKVVKKPLEDSQIDVWIDPTKAWLPVQIRIKDKKGISFTQKLNAEGG